MDDLEARLRALATHRADQVPRFEPTAGVATGRSRQRVLLLAAAVVVVIALVAGGVAVLSSSGDDGASVRVPPATDAPTTTPATSVEPARCAAPADANVDAKEGTASRDPGPFATPLVNVDTQVSDCSDAVVFVFGATPAWQAAYDGDGNLVVTFPAARGPYFGEPVQRASTMIQPSAPWRAGAVSLLDPAATTQTWTIATGSRRPFRVDAAEGSLTVEISEVAPIKMSCTNPDLHLALTLPAGWFAEVSPYWTPCQFFGQRPFGLVPDSDVRTDTVSPGISPTSPSDSDTRVSSSETTVDGRPAQVVESVSNGASLFPAGTHFYQYSVDWSPTGWLVLAVHGEPGPVFDADKAGLDAIAATLQYTG
jgi:hypothetical protein